MNTKPVFIVTVFTLLNLVGQPFRTPRPDRSIPPNCVRIADNLFTDKTEVSNLDWREYIFWLQRVDPARVPSALPDTLVWQQSPQYGEPLAISYFRHPAFDTYPVVGVSLEQVRAYCIWRTDRVYEVLLMEANKIPYNPEQTSGNYFSTEKYLAGAYQGLKPDLSVAVPRFRLPSEAEWEQAARGRRDLAVFPFGYDFDEKRYRRRAKGRPRTLLFNTLETERLSTRDPYWSMVKMPDPSRSGPKNDWGIFQMLGNVSEMTDQPGIAKGGNYQTPFEECRVAGRQTYAGPNHLTGFRCVCSWEMPK